METRARKLGITKFPYNEYDKYGQHTYHENEDGSWWEAEYDERFDEKERFETLVRFSNGNFIKREFDENGMQIYCETSNGVISDYRDIAKEYRDKLLRFLKPAFIKKVKKRKL